MMNYDFKTREGRAKFYKSEDQTLSDLTVKISAKIIIKDGLLLILFDKPCKEETNKRISISKIKAKKNK